MFEDNTKFDQAALPAAPFVPGNGTALSAQTGGTALRAFGWSELIARINASRDLRRVLRRDNAYGSSSFGDAAAGYFNPLGNSKQGVNHGALEHGKSNWRKASSAEENAATGDREK